MRTIGLRAEPRGFNWAVAEGSLEAPILVKTDRVLVPANYSIASGLHFLRLSLQQILGHYQIQAAGLRTPERTARDNELLRERLRVEGMLLAECAQAGLDPVQGAIGTMSSRLGIKSAKVLMESAKEYRGVDFAKYTKEKIEAILMSISVLPGE